MKLSDRRHCILYAEESEDSRDLVRMICKLSDIDIFTTGSSAEAWQLAQTECVDLYLLDSRFSDGDGLQLCRLLREFAPQAPILFYSADAYETDKQKGLAAGANDYLTKPFFGDLGAIIRQNIEQTKKPIRETASILL